ncbi:MAG: S8 family serine peptidase [Rhizobiaceae bacterium]|nr:S8 family serine peptidase [Rhizobiaceae bacterium]
MAAVQGILSQAEEVIEARPEYYLYAIAAHVDDSQRTWGLDATGVVDCPFTGKGIKVAILDTGVDRRHPDFAGRTIVEKLFVDASSLTDVVGHGTHCAGTAVGPRSPGVVAPGYGCAPDAELYVGKVLNDAGFAEEGSVAEGIEWATEQGCHVISLSLGREVRPGEKPTPFYERLGKTALDMGCLIVAASGNNSERTSGSIAPVSEPANSPSIMAVGAVDPTLRIAFFSNGAVNPAGGSLDIVAPGTSVFSSFIAPKDYEILMGTSMACPHVAGVAALWAESDPALRGQALWDALVASAKPIGLPKRDGGAGLVQAPTKGAGMARVPTV